MPIRSFLDLDVYQRAYKVSITVHKEIIPNLPPNEKYDLGDQMGRASKAIPAIIAEGYSRKNHKRAWQKYIDDSIGEANEMIVHLSLAKDLYPNLIDTKLCDKLIEEYNIIGKQLFRLGKSWNSHSSSTSPDSRLTSHVLTPLALTIDQFGKIQSPVPTFQLPNILQTASSLLLLFAILLTLFFLIWGGFDMITSEGDKQRISNARHKLAFAVIGLVVVFLSFFVVGVVGDIFGINFLH